MKLLERSATAAPRPLARLRALRPEARDQLVVAGGQLGAGIANFAFVMVLARMLRPDAFAATAAFLALYLLVNVFAGSLGAGTALRPDDFSRLRSRLWRVGFGVLIVCAIATEPVSSLLGLPGGLVLALGAAAPVAGVLATARGRLYGERRYADLVTSLAAEPAVRLTLGLAFASMFGARGAATAVAIGAWAAFALAAPDIVGPRWSAFSRRLVPRLPVQPLVPCDGVTSGDPARRPSVSDSRVTTLVFLGLAVVTNQDLLLANRMLPAGDAAAFAVVSTLGGMAIFATTTVPLVLLGQKDRRDALAPALAVAAALGTGATLLVAVSPQVVVSLAFGTRYSGVGRLAIAYLTAMGVLGVGRVIAAHLCAHGQGRWAFGAVTATAVVQSGLLLRARTPGEVVRSTFVAVLVLIAVLVAGTRSTSARVRVVRDRLHAVEWHALLPPADVIPRLRIPRLRIPRLRIPRLRIPQLRRPQLRRPDVRLPPLSVPQLDAPRAPRRVREAFAVAVHRLRTDRALAAVAGLTAAGLGVRIVVGRSIWLDEAISVAQAKLPFRQMIQQVGYGDVHPPLHAALMWVTVRTIGDSELAARLPSILVGTLIVPLLYMVGRELYDRRTGLVAAVLGTAAPLLVWYSQEARMYSMFGVLALAAVLGQFRAIRRGRPRDWILYGLATGALLWTQYFAVLQIVAQQGVFAWVALTRFRRREPVGRYLAWWTGATVAAIVLFLPELPILRTQLSSYAHRDSTLRDIPARTGTLSASSGDRLTFYALIANVVWSLWGYHADHTMAQIVAFWPIGMLFGLFLLGRGSSPSTRHLLFLAAVPFAALAVLGLFKRDLFEVRYASGAVPIVVLLVARVITAGFRTDRARRLATAAMLVTLVAGLVDEQVNRTNPRLYDFRGVLHRVESMARPGDAIFFEPPYLDPVVRYYAPQTRARRLSTDVERPSSDRVILVTAFLDHPDIAARVGWALSKLEQRYGRPETFVRSQVRVWVFT